jgi:hypothetical protein
VELSTAFYFGIMLLMTGCHHKRQDGKEWAENEKSVRQTKPDGHMMFYLVKLTNSLLISFAVSGLVILAICLMSAVLSESIKMFTFLPRKYPAIFSACAFVMEILN